MRSGFELCCLQIISGEILMERNVQVNIKGLHNNEDDSTSVGTISDGKYYLRNGKHYISYEETDAESGQKSNSIIKIYDENVELIRRGNAATHLYFGKGKVHKTSLQTIMGLLFIEIDTEKVELDFSETGIKAVVEYSILMDGERVSNSKVEISVKYV